MRWNTDPSETDCDITIALESLARPTLEVGRGVPSECSDLMKPDIHLGGNARHIEVSGDQTASSYFR